MDIEHALRNFRQLNQEQRAQMAAKIGQLTPAQLNEIKQHNDEINELIVENYLTNYQFPEGLAATIRMNGNDYLVPMVTEEASVIAAASYGGKMTAAGDGIIAHTDKNLLMGQIVFQTVTQAEINRFVLPRQSDLLKLANDAHPSILSHGGGARDIRVRSLGEGYVSVDLFVDTGAAMGANIMNGMLEALGHHLQDVLEQHPVMSILTNDGQANVVTATAIVPVENLAKGNFDEGLVVAKRIVAASDIAQLDSSRATTHNKGIMNGVDAAVIAFGNDWRAVEASAHAFAVKDGQYRGLSRWQIVDKQLIGTMQMPMHLGLVGGVTKSLPLVRVNQQIARVDNVNSLNQLVVSLGLAQNLAALRALVSEGIQHGHMHLQFRNLALAAGATPEQVSQVVDELSAIEHADLAAARVIVATLNRTND